MKISELICQLTSIQNEYGDIPVLYSGSDGCDEYDIDSAEVRVNEYYKNLDSKHIVVLV